MATAAMSAHALDRDDLHWGSVTHPGSMIWPALLVVGTRLALPLHTVLDAGALGYQVIARTAGLLGTDHRRAFHVSTTAGTIGVAAAVAAATGRAENEIAAAMSHAASTMGGTGQAVRQHARTALLHRAVAAVSGTLAAQHAQLTPAVIAPLDGPHGFAAATGIELDHGQLDEAAPPVVCGVTLRVHPVNGFSHSVVEAALSIPKVDPERIRSVVVTVPDVVTEFTETEPDIDPVDPAWHLPHIVALCLVGVLPAPALPAQRIPAAERLRGRVTVTGHAVPRDSLRAEVRVTLSDGQTLLGRVDVPHGHPDDPLSDGELIQKAVSLGVCTTDEGEGLLDDLRTARTSTDRLPIPCLSSQAR
jgi:2-methylcitrate dehydratase PrpD